MKFPTDFGVGVAQGNQLESRKCYVAALKGKSKPAGDLDLERPTEQGEERASPTEETVAIPT